MIIQHYQLFQYQIPLDALLPVGKQRIDCRHGVVIVIEVDIEGVMNPVCVEVSPLSGLDVDGQPLTGFSQESLAQVIGYLKTELPSLLGEQSEQLLQLSQCCPLPSVSFGLSLLHAKLHQKIGLRQGSQQTVPLIYQDSDEPLHLLQAKVAALSASVNAVKVKVGQTDLESDIKLIHAILATKPNLKLRLDANRSFSLDAAITFAACMPKEAIEYIEEPCQCPSDNQAFFEALGIPYALDESLNNAKYQFTMQPGLAALVIKPMLLGSIEKLSELIDTAHSHGVRCILSSSLEASLGIQDLSRLAATLTPDEVPGINTLKAFSQDLVISSGKKRCLSTDNLSLIARSN